MALTRKFLKELGLGDETIERVIAAHASTVEGLRGERDAALAAVQEAQGSAQEREELRRAAEDSRREAEGVRGEFEAFRQETERLRTLRREAFLAGALRRAGANETAIPLLVKAIPAHNLPWDGDSLPDEGAALRGVMCEYAGLFAQVEPLPTDVCTPPLSEDMLSQEDVRRMSAEEINRNWESVRGALEARG